MTIAPCHLRRKFRRKSLKCGHLGRPCPRKVGGVASVGHVHRRSHEFGFTRQMQCSSQPVGWRSVRPDHVVQRKRANGMVDGCQRAGPEEQRKICSASFGVPCVRVSRREECAARRSEAQLSVRGARRAARPSGMGQRGRLGRGYTRSSPRGDRAVAPFRTLIGRCACGCVRRAAAGPALPAANRSSGSSSTSRASGLYRTTTISGSLTTSNRRFKTELNAIPGFRPLALAQTRRPITHLEPRPEVVQTEIEWPIRLGPDRLMHLDNLLHNRQRPRRRRTSWLPF